MLLLGGFGGSRGSDGGRLLFQPDVKVLDVEGGAKGVKDNVFLGLGGSGGLPGMAGGRGGDSF